MGEEGGSVWERVMCQAVGGWLSPPPCVTDILTCLGGQREEPALDLFDEAGIIRDLKLYHGSGKERWEGSHLC